MKNLKNLPPFYAGQIVKANCNHRSGLIKGNKYKILDIKLGHCSFIVNIGLLLPDGFSKNLALCTTCNKVYTSDTKGSWWLKVDRFDSVQESPFPSLTMKEVVKKEQLLTCMN